MIDYSFQDRQILTRERFLDHIDFGEAFFVSRLLGVVSAAGSKKTH